MENPAKPSDLDDRGYVFPDNDSVTVEQTNLDAAWRALQRQLRKNGTSAEAILASGWATTDDLVDIVCAATMRVLDNPMGLTQETGTVDDYSESRTFANSSSDLYFTSAEISSLIPPLPTAGSMPYSR